MHVFWLVIIDLMLLMHPITDPNCVPIESLHNLWPTGKCVYKTVKTACNVCVDVLTEWRVKPNDVEHVVVFSVAHIQACG